MNLGEWNKSARKRDSLARARNDEIVLKSLTRCDSTVNEILLRYPVCETSARSAIARLIKDGRVIQKGTRKAESNGRPTIIYGLAKGST